ncbi:MAG: ThuA domain-containing protein [Bryobacterales bacterium]|nr:ThuA domain-containing protein [Bryobacterales bacterium]
MRPRLAAIVLTLASFCFAADKRVLVYTRNYTPDGKGYVHDNIATSVEAIRKMGAENNFDTDHSEDPKVFNDANLKKYAAIVFASSNNEAFENDAQREAFQRYIRGGGGFVGIHSASGSERKWPWYWAMLGGTFLRHPKMQPFLVRVIDSNHPSTRALPASFEWTDECYYHKELNPGLKILLVTDPAKLDDPKWAEAPGATVQGMIPLAWYHNFEGGRSYFIALGHKKEHYSNPLLYGQILGGIQWAMGVKQ